MLLLVQYADQIQEVGPMVRTWTIRHEAKLINFFKQASHLVDFKIIAFVVVNYHQRWMCYEHSSEKLTDTSTQCGPAVKGNSGTCVYEMNPEMYKRV